jgi:hypothetical protein
MSQRLKICSRCMERLNASQEGADLGSYLVATGNAGIELVSEAECQYRLFCGDKARPQKPPRALADVTEVEIDAAIGNLLKELDLRSYTQQGSRELSAAIKNEWQKARTGMQQPPSETPLIPRQDSTR